jgi:hypothetical protein
MSVTALDLPSWPLADEREGLAEEVRTVGMVWEREAIRFFRTRTQILSSFIQPVLFLFVLGYGMSTLVGTAAGFDFKKFLFSGIAATTVMSTARCRLCRPAHAPGGRGEGLQQRHLVRLHAVNRRLRRHHLRLRRGVSRPGRHRLRQARLTGGHASGQVPDNQDRPIVRQGRAAAQTEASRPGRRRVRAWA